MKPQTRERTAEEIKLEYLIKEERLRNFARGMAWREECDLWRRRAWLCRLWRWICRDRRDQWCQSNLRVEKNADKYYRDIVSDDAEHARKTAEYYNTVDVYRRKHGIAPNHD